MGGGNKARQNKAERKSARTAQREKEAASSLSGQLAERQTALVGDTFGLSGSLAESRAGAQDLRATGGFDPAQIEALRTKINSLGGEEGYGREGYADFAKTGGFTPESEAAFRRQATAPTAAIYNRSKDELGRRLSLQGGYSPGYGTSSARLTRQAAQAGSEASLGADVQLEQLKREGKLAGLGGLASTRTAIGAERVAGIESGRALEGQVASGKIAGQDALDRYSQVGLSAITNTDVLQLQNRLQTGNISLADAQLLASMSVSDPSTFSKIMSGIGGAIGAVAPFV